MLQSMMASRFCMVVPGDSQSSERLTDAFVSGAGLAAPDACPCAAHSVQDLARACIMRMLEGHVMHIGVIAWTWLESLVHAKQTGYTASCRTCLSLRALRQ